MKWHPLINMSTFCLYQLEVCLIFRRDFCLSVLSVLPQVGGG